MVDPTPMIPILSPPPSWLCYVTSPDGPEPLTRLVLLAAHLYLAPADRGEWVDPPSFVELATDTGLEADEVERRLRDAARDGWLVIDASGLRWEAKVPAGIDADG